MVSWAYGWQFPDGFLDYIQTVVPGDPSPDPGFGQVLEVYDYAEGHLLLYLQPTYLTYDPYLRDLMNAMGEELSVLRATLDRVLENKFLEHTSEWGLQLWESLAGVAVAPDNIGTVARRALVKSKIVSGPRTVQDFLDFIEYFTGVDGSIIENYSTYSLDVTVFSYLTPEEQAQFEQAFEEAIPAHLGVDSYTYSGFIAGISTAGDSL